MNIRKITPILFTFVFLGISILYSQNKSVNYDELKAGPYSLPSIQTSQSGVIINNVQDWEEFRKPEILYSFTNHVYGRVPGVLDSMLVKITEQNGTYLNGTAKRKQVMLTFVKNGKELSVDLLIYLPISMEKAPVFLGYNFQGNHTIADDRNIFITKSWVPINSEIGVESNFAVEKSRGSMKTRWDIEKIIEAGYGLVTLYRGDIDPDKDDLSDGIHQLFYTKEQEKPKPDEWGTIAAWSWGLSRVMDFLETDQDIDHEKVIVFGHSRLGKASLWAAATDSRFAGCISNNSGAMGAALSRRDFGETVEVINKAFPYWFCDNFKKYSNKEYMLPVDQHMLISLIAPRPVYLASATEDLWADPKGEFLSAKEASVVYNLYGIPGLSSLKMPEPDSPIIGVVSYHLRTGIHDVTDYDWEQYIKFAKYNNF
ncbi:MAG: acetylxylan esterase [Fermentimonas sp.]|nr:acetylxylan esterase [Fermentimonas sp.]